MSDNQEADMYSRGLEKAQKEIKELKSLIKEATPWVACVKEITELPEYRQAIATKVLIEWLEKAEKIK